MTRGLVTGELKSSSPYRVWPCQPVAKSTWIAGFAEGTRTGHRCKSEYRNSMFLQYSRQSLRSVSVRHEVKIADFGLSKCLRRVGEQEAGLVGITVILNLGSTDSLAYKE